MLVWVFDDANCFLEATLPIDPLDGEEVCSHDGLGNVHHLLQPPSFLNQAAMQSVCVFSTFGSLIKAFGNMLNLLKPLKKQFCVV